LLAYYQLHSISVIFIPRHDVIRYKGPLAGYGSRRKDAGILVVIVRPMLSL
jgi:hypothetical protein